MRKSLWFIYTSFIGWLLLCDRRGIIRWEFMVALFFLVHLVEIVYYDCTKRRSDAWLSASCTYNDVGIMI